MEIITAIAFMFIYIYLAFVTIGLHIRMWGNKSMLAEIENATVFYGVFWAMCFPLSIFIKICILSFEYLKGHSE